jgi:hypothetical protein
VLVTDPGPGQEFFFWQDLLHVVFIHGAVRKLFAAYGRTLSAVVHAASGKHPPPAPGFDAATVLLDELAVAPSMISHDVLAPAESALADAVLGHDCLEQQGQTKTGETVTLKMELQPLTNYVLDITATPPAGDALHPLFRRMFSTSRYPTMAALGAAVAGTPVRHRRVADPLPLTQLGAGLMGAPPVQVAETTFESALRQLRWGDLGRLAQPKVTVIWSDGVAGNPPQPAALLIESPEPLWRWWPKPTDVSDAAGTRRYQLAPEMWLDLVETPAAGALVSRFVTTAGGGRTLVVLAPGARGGTLQLALRRRHRPLIEGDSNVETAALISAALAAAPWEIAP